MKKKFLAFVSAAALAAMSSMTAFASSPTVGTTEQPVSTQTVSTTIEDTNTPDGYAAATTVSEGFSVQAVSQTTADSARVAVQNLILNDVAAIGSALGNASITAAATNSGQRVTATILSTVEVDPTSATRDANGNYNVTIGVVGISAGDAIAVLHYNGSAWEVIRPTAVANGAVSFTTSSLSPISIVKLSLSGVSQAPRTGESVPFSALLVLCGVVGLAVCGKKLSATK